MRFIVTLLAGLSLLAGCTAGDDTDDQPIASCASASSSSQTVCVRPTSDVPDSVVQTVTDPASYRCADNQVSVAFDLNTDGSYQGVTIFAMTNKFRSVTDVLFDQPASDLQLAANALIVGSEAGKNQQVVDLQGVPLNQGVSLFAEDFTVGGDQMDSPNSFELCIAR